jgi:hypothetical protein
MSLDGKILSLATTSTRLYATGRFRIAGDAAVWGVAVWEDESWSALEPSPPVNLRTTGMNRLAVEDDNVWLTAPNASGALRGMDVDLLHWNGTSWRQLRHALHGQFSEITAHSGALYFFGAGIQRWDQAGVTQVAASPVPGLQAERVVFLPDGRLCAIVDRSAGLHEVLVRNNHTWEPLDGGLVGGHRPFALLVDGEWLYAGGDFTGVGSAEPPAKAPQVPFGGYPKVAGIARWSARSGWEPVGPFHRSDFLSQRAAITALATWRGQIFAGGSFRRLGGVQALNLARWDGRAWHELGGGVKGEVRALAVMGGHLYVGGTFRQGVGRPDCHLARWRLE